MYAEFNLRLFFYLLFHPADAVCAIDLDTILACYLATEIKGIKRIYDAHELFTEQKEIITRPTIQKLWLQVAQFAVPQFVFGYTVNGFIARELKRKYLVNYGIIRNLPYFFPVIPGKKYPPFILYQGAVNEGRCFETLIPAMKKVNADLFIYGNGNFFEQAKLLIKNNDLTGKVSLKGYATPEELKQITPSAAVAVTLFENTGLNQYHSLSNRFFDYIMAGVPQVCIDYPEYKIINDEYGIAYMIPNTEAETISKALNRLLTDKVLYASIQQNCLKARQVLNWENEEKKLVQLYSEVFR